MRWLILLLAFSAHGTAVYVKQIGTTEYAFSFTTNGMQYCWIMPEWADRNYLNTTWTTVPQTAIDRNWPAPTMEQGINCNDAPRVPRTLAGNMYFIIPESPVPIPAGIPCGDPVSYTFNGYTLMSVTYNSKIGFALCR
jgi:hypothetical protein